MLLSGYSITILRIITRLNIGGPAIQAISLSEELSSGEFKSVLIAGQVGSNEEDMSYLASEKGIEPILIKELGREISFFDDIKAILSLRSLIIKFKPDIVHTHTAKAGALGRLATISVNLFCRKRKKIRIVHTFHGHVFHSYFNKYKTWIFILVEKFLGRFTDRIIVISTSQKEDICYRFGIVDEKKTKIIPLGFNLSIFKKDEEERINIRKKFLKEIELDSFVVGIVGRLTGVKNHSLLLQALYILKNQKRIRKLICMIVGDGELKEDLKSEVAELGLDELVVFTGWQKDMAIIYKAFDAVILTSKNEGTPVAIIEAMASGIPAAATDVGGVRDLFGKIEEKTEQGFSIGENGILMESDNLEAVAGAVLYLINEKEMVESMARKAQNYVRKNYSFERLSDDIKSLYRELTYNK